VKASPAITYAVISRDGDGSRTSAKAATKLDGRTVLASASSKTSTVIDSRLCLHGPVVRKGPGPLLKGMPIADLEAV